MTSFYLLDFVVVFLQGKPVNRGFRSQGEFQISLVNTFHYSWKNTHFLRALRIMRSKLTLGRFLPIPESEETIQFGYLVSAVEVAWLSYPSLAWKAPPT